jgi:hypothetical protein
MMGSSGLGTTLLTGVAAAYLEAKHSELIGPELLRINVENNEFIVWERILGCVEHDTLCMVHLHHEV